jgi:hypothetical protein
MRRLPARGKSRRGVAVAVARATGPGAGLALALIAGALSPGCTEFEPGDDVLRSAQGDLEPAGPGEDWSCLDVGDGMFAPPAPVSAGTARTIMYPFYFVDLSSGGVYPDIQVRACGVADPTCASQVGPTLRVNPDGRVSMPLFENFVGFIEVTSPQIVPTMYYLIEPVTSALDPEFPNAVVAVSAIKDLVRLTGVEPKDETGIFATRAFDCRGVPAPNVTFDMSIDGAPYYFVRGLPSGVATSTDSTGLAGFTNISPGLAIIEGTLPDGASIGGPQSVVIRSGWMSAFFLRPPGRLLVGAQ